MRLLKMTLANCTGILFGFSRMPHSQNIIFAIIYLSIAAAAVCVNLLLIAAMVGTKQALSNTLNTLIICMSIVDLLNGMINLPALALLRLNYESKVNCTLALACQFVGICFGCLSLLITVLLAIDRYLHMRTTFTRKRSIILKLFRGKWILFPLASVTILSVSISVFYTSLHRLSATAVTITATLMTLLMLIFLPGVAAMYIRAYVRVRTFVRNNPVYNEADCQIQPDNRGIASAKRNENEPAYLIKLQRTVLMLVTALLIVYTPFVIANTSQSILYTLGEQPKAMIILNDVASLAIMSNYIINSLVIFKMNKKARSWVLKLVNNVKCWRDVESYDLQNANNIVDRSHCTAYTIKQL